MTLNTTTKVAPFIKVFYLPIVFGLFALNMWWLTPPSVLKLVINSLFAAVGILFFYQYRLGKDWLGWAKGVAIFIVSYALLWILLGEFSKTEINRLIDLPIIAIFIFRPADSSWKSAFRVAGCLFYLAGFYYLLDGIAHHFF